MVSATSPGEKREQQQKHRPLPLGGQEGIPVYIGEESELTQGNLYQ